MSFTGYTVYRHTPWWMLPISPRARDGTSGAAPSVVVDEDWLTPGREFKTFGGSVLRSAPALTGAFGADEAASAPEGPYVRHLHQIGFLPAGIFVHCDDDTTRLPPCESDSIVHAAPLHMGLWPACIMQLECQFRIESVSSRFLAVSLSARILVLARLSVSPMSPSPICKLRPACLFQPPECVQRVPAC